MGTYDLNITGINKSFGFSLGDTQVSFSNAIDLGPNFGKDNYTSGGISRISNGAFFVGSVNSQYSGYSVGLAEIFVPENAYIDASENINNQINTLAYNGNSNGYLANINVNSFTPSNRTFSVTLQTGTTNSDFATGAFTVTDGQNFSTSATFVSQAVVNGQDVVTYQLAQAPSASGIYHAYVQGYSVTDNGLDSTPTLNVTVPSPPTYTIAVSANGGAAGATATGNEGGPDPGTTFTYTVTRSGDASQTGTVSLAFGGTATPPGGTGTADYSIASGTGTYTATGSGNTGTLAFAANQSTATFTVTSTPDTIYEPDEFATATLTAVTNGGGTLGATTSATVTILNDDAAPTLAIGPANVAHPEGNSGTTSFDYTVTRSGDAQAAETVNYAVTGSGTNPASASDFTGGVLPSGTVTFAQGETTKPISVPVMGDTTVEPDEGFTVTLSNPNFGTITQATATGTILNDDAAPSSGGNSSGPIVSTTPTPGPDLLTGTPGSDTIAGLAGDDTIYGGGGNDLLLGNQGNDSITDGDGQSTILGGMGNDSIAVGNGSNLLYGGEGADTITAGNGGNTILGGTGNAAIDSLDGADLILSGSGNDLILGNGGDDTIGAGGGNDTAVGGYGNDVILGQQGDDILLGNQGDDTLVGGQGNDTLVGGQGNDVLYGSEGDDVLYGNEGSNRFVFNPGDTDFRSGASTGDVVMDFKSGTDKIDFASGPVGTAANFGATSTTATDFASIQALAQTLINGGDAYAFVANGTDGFLFTTGGSGTAITDAVKLAGAGSASAVRYGDIAHGALA